MRIERHRSLVTITTVPRSTLEHTRHKEIDAILKDLRTCSRRLKAALDGLKDELRTLERLYYKCKNQHRMALFFKRVLEMRRYGQRLSELDILERVDLLRASFVGLEHTNDHKALRGSWSNVPEGPYVDFLTERLTASSALVCEMRERLEKAYNHFTWAMQNGSFVQLIILFVAISCRMSLLSSQLEEALQLSISTCNRLSVIIHPTTSSEPDTLRPSHIDHNLYPEDTGQLISCSGPTDTSAFVVEVQSKKLETTLEVRVTPLPSHRTNAADYTTAQVSKKVTEKVVQNPRLKKTKKKYDEIDEIFFGS